MNEPICECNTGMACPVPAHWGTPRCRYDAAEDYCDSCDRPYQCPTARALVAAVEQPSEDEPLCGIEGHYCGNLPAAPPSEPLCQCGHTSDMHTICHFDHNECLCGCRRFDPPIPSRTSISDEAEAWAEWFRLHHASLRMTVNELREEAFLAGFRAARQEEA